MKTFYRHLLLLLFPLISRGQDLVFNSFQIEHGLSQNSVIAIAEDSDGFMWFGTSNGLNRFDGSNFKIYSSVPGDSTSLTSSYVLSLYVDSKKQLWVGTDSGLNLYDAQMGNFKRIELVAYASDNINTLAINGIGEDKEGRLMVASDAGLYRAGIDGSHRFEKIPLYNGFSEEIYSMRTLLRDSMNNLWIGTDGAMIRITISDNIVNQTYLPLESGEASNVSYISSIKEISEGSLCIGTNLGGIFLYNVSTNTFRNITRSSQDAGLISNIVRSVYVDPSTNIWVGTRYGISIFNEACEFIQNYEQDRTKYGSLTDNSVRSIYQDSRGSIWVGTFFGGANITDPSFFPVSALTFDVNSNGLTNSIVSAVLYDQQNRLILGTEGGGINIFDRNRSRIKTLEWDPAIENSLSLNNVKCIFRDSDGLYWIGTSGGGADVYDAHFNLKYKVKGRSKNDREDYVYSIAEDKDGTIWLGTFGGGLNYFDKESQILHHVADSSTNLTANELIFKVFHDSKDRLWIGTSNKLLTFNTTTRDFERIFHADPAEAAEGVYAIIEDRSGAVWIGTEGGVKKYENETDSFIAFTTADGLPDNHIVGMLEDPSDGDLWLCTNKGLCRFSPEVGLCKNYTTEDGLLDLGFNRNATGRSPQGELFFGSRNGLISFFPDHIKENRQVGSIKFTDLKVFNEDVQVNDESGILDRQLSDLDRIVLKHDQNFITVGFSLLSYIKPSKNKYAYMLEGIDNQWNYVNTPSATYTNLPDGDFRLLVKASNNDGYWSEVPATLRISILPAPWQTWWAYTIYTIVLSGLIYLMFYFQHVKTKLQHELKIEHLLLKQEEEVHQIKMRFFTNISHEIRTPLTLIISPIEKLIAEYRHEHRIFQQLMTVKVNADRLLRLVNQLLDFRKKEIGETELKVARGNIINFIKEIWLSFLEQAKEKELLFIHNIEPEETQLWYDRDELEKVFFNLFSNALKFAHRGKKVELAIPDKVTTADGVQYFEIKVINEGKGIPDHIMEKIFDRFYSSDSHHEYSAGFGIGLALSKNIVEAHAGKINASSHRVDDQTWRTEFTVMLPFGQKHFHEDQLIDNFENSENLRLYQEKELGEPLAVREVTTRISNEEDTPIILLAEDNEDIRAYVKSCLETTYDVIEAKNGSDAWVFAIEKIPDMVITDVLMPELDGIQLCSKLKTDQRTSHIPIIILSARTSLIHRVDGLKTGADDYLTKPFHVDELLLKIKNILRSREILREKYSNQFILQPENLDVTSTEKDFLEKLTDIIEKHIADPHFHIPDFSNEIGMSRSVIYRKLKSITGMTLIEFVNDYRLNKASILLKHKKLNISQTATEVGFSDPNYFSKSFKKKYGISPTDYIRKN